MTAGEATREFYREQGRKQEQQRIIKLLEDELEKSGSSLDFDAEFYAGIHLSIALIKGEK